MKRLILLFFSLLLTLSVFGSALSVKAADRSAEDICHDILQNQYKKAGVTDPEDYAKALSESVGDGREWYLFALAVSDKTLDLSAYATALEAYLAEKHIANAVTRQKYAMLLLACGHPSAFVKQTANDAVGELGVMSYIFGLHLANNGYTPDHMTREEIVEALLSMRLADGGYAVTGTAANPDVTAMALQALAPYYGIRKDVKTAIDADLTLLSEKQMENGGFIAYGIENPESAAQMMLVLTSLGIDPDTDARFSKNGNTLMDSILRFALADGTFSHEMNGQSNENAGMQVLLAMTAKAQNKNPYLIEPLIFEPKVESTTDIRILVVLGILAAALLTCLILFLCKKRNIKQYLAVGILAVLASLLVFVIKIESPDTYYGSTEKKENPIGTVTLSIRCDVLVGKTDSDYVPEDGTILAPTVFEIEEGDTVYSVLEEAVRTHHIHMEASGGSTLAYVEGIAYLYELQFGDLSGWSYSVNGKPASVGCGTYVLSPDDVIVWEYTLDLK